MVKQKKSFQIPETLLRSLDECTNNGYLLFTFNDQGAPDVHAAFDNPIASLAMQTWVKNWIMAVEQTHLEMTKNSMLMSQRKK